MPDHLHLLVAVGPKSSLAATVRLFKGRLMPALRKAGLQWQPAYFDHRMRPTEERLPVFRYLFLNPYRAGLIARNEKWPGYYCCPGDWAWFSSLVENDCPVPEWLA